MITTHNITTTNGNTLSVFYNTENNLLVVDLVAKDETHGNEIVRQTLDETMLLGFVTKRSKKVKQIS
jgi:hypothetical protein